MADMEVIDLLSMKNPVFCTFILWSSLLVLKMLGMSLLTAFNRFRYKIFALLPEFILKKFFADSDGSIPDYKNMTVEFFDPKVERVRRAHRNDMENILPYFTIGIFYISTNPNVWTSKMLFVIATLARLLHTSVYAHGPVPQPARIITWAIHFLVTGYMAFYVLFSDALRFI